MSPMNQMHNLTASPFPERSFFGLNMKLIKNILFFPLAIVLGYFMCDSIRMVAQIMNKIPNDQITFGLWGKAYFWRVVGSFVGMTVATSSLAIFYKEKFKLPIILYASLVSLFWLFIASIGFWGFSSKQIEAPIGVPIMCLVMGLIAPFFIWKLGHYFSKSEEKNRFYNIKWRHWAWILPVYLSKALAVLIILTLAMWQVDSVFSSYPSMFEFIFKWKYTLLRIALLFIIAGICCSVSHFCSLMKDENPDGGKVKTGLKIAGHILLMNVLYIVFIATQIAYPIEETSEPSPSRIGQKQE